jgi:hypothetical protein
MTKSVLSQQFSKLIAHQVIFGKKAECAQPLRLEAVAGV